MSLREAVETVIAESTGRSAAWVHESAVGGGCISQAQRITLEDGRSFFLKSNDSPLPGMFAREAEGLEALAAPGVLRVPAVIGVGDAPTPFLVLEDIAPGPRNSQFSITFGRKLALLHQETTSERAGFACDNYIGSTPQPNGWTENWVDFWREHRLGFQLDLARRNGLATREFNDLGDRLSANLETLLAEPDEPMCLLHGDLWGGNYLVDETGDAVLIDPATYYGRREADIAMTTLFGGFDRHFYDGYNDVWPLAPGSEARIELYALYHLLNHLNLFGLGYYDQCATIMRRYT